MAASSTSSTLLTLLQNKATQLRIESVRSTSEAGSGHPSSCCSAADIVAALFFSVMRYDPRNPKAANSDRFVLSKGHAAPLLYAAWAEAGLFPKSDLLKLRTLTSDLEGHPTPRLSFVDMATGSLGQGLAAGGKGLPEGAVGFARLQEGSRDVLLRRPRPADERPAPGSNP